MLHDALFTRFFVEGTQGLLIVCLSERYKKSFHLRLNLKLIAFLLVSHILITGIKYGKR